MKLILKLIPGVVATMAVALVAFAVAQSNSSPVPQAAAPGYALPAPAPIPLPAPGLVQPLPMPAPMQFVICGACGARIYAPQPVLVAAPVYPPRQTAFEYYRDSYDPAGCEYLERQRIPLRPVISLSADRIDPRRIPHQHEIRYRN